jgi:signal transduction histidine kinase
VRVPELGSRAWARLWEALRPLDPCRSVKAALGALVIASVVITTLLALFAVNSATELRVITIFSIIASLLITQFVAQSLTAPLDEMTEAARAMADGDSEADPETMRTSLAQTERLGRLVDHLLDLSRLDNGVVPLHARRFEVWPYLAGVLKEANMSKGSGHARTDVHLHLDVSPPELTAHADAERLHQVVANLIDNAVKHSPAHGRVTVRARQGEAPESLEVEVLDEGPGIPEAERAQVFERFSRTKSTVAKSGNGIPGAGARGGQGVGDGGTGLGLAIARWAVDLHGGSIRVAESPRGCRIRVTLPGVGESRD